MTVLIATTSALVRVGDRVHRIRRRRTTAHPDSPIVAEHPDMWEPMRVDFPAELDAPPAELDAPPAEPVIATGPSLKAVRAWAKAEGIDVPARGKLPDEVIARYQAAHEQGD